MNEAANQNKEAFTTKAKSPRVTIVTGRVKIRSIGLIIIFKIPNTTAAIKAE